MRKKMFFSTQKKINSPDYTMVFFYLIAVIIILTPGISFSQSGNDEILSVSPVRIEPDMSTLKNLMITLDVKGIFDEIPLKGVQFGDPIPGLTTEELAAFEAGRDAFMEVETVADGLGPIFNGRSCVECHDLGAVGGGSNNRFELRFGRRISETEFDPLMDLGGSLLQMLSIGSEGTPMGCVIPVEIIPPEANVVTQRRSLPLFGSGLLDSVTDSQIVTIAYLQSVLSPKTAGRVSIADNIAADQPTVSRFGWKGQVPTLFQFSGKAYVDEMGITSPDFPLENCPNGPPDCALVQECDPVPGVDDDMEDIELFFNFMRALAPPPRGKITCEVLAGEKIFYKIGCADCHLPTLVSGPSDLAALSKKIFHPYTDLLLHDMGSLGDGTSGDQANASLVEGNADPREMRTQPLWGLRIQDKLLHNRRANSPAEAILFHDGQGRASREAFKLLAPVDRHNLLEFLDSL